MYPDPRVTRFITEQLRPVRVHVKDDAEAWKTVGQELGVQWTPTVLIVGGDGKEHHRIEGFLPADEFLAQLMIGLAKAAFSAGRFDDAERRYRDVLEQLPETESAAEAQYWSGVSRYKGSNDPTALTDTAAAFTNRYQESSWAKKASVWRS